MTAYAFSTFSPRLAFFAIALAVVALTLLGAGDAAACSVTGGGDFPC